MSDLFDAKNKEEIQRSAPLADRIRPESLSNFVGQEHIVGEGKLLRQAIEGDEVPSIILWGPPGSGKTTLGRIIAALTKSAFVMFHAVTSGVGELRRVIEEAEERRRLYGKRTILFVDEIHRWNKAQQDALLPYVENGILTLIGATTENPSFEVVSALLSRCRVFTLNKLDANNIRAIIERALKDNVRGFGRLELRVSEPTIDYLSRASQGDARVALNALELAVGGAARRKSKDITKEDITEALQATYLKYDKGGEEHYNIISALHKSLRGSDVNAALYWLGRMLEAGEDPLYVARRLVRFASEDVGLADPQALTLAVSGYQATHFIGLPECNVVLAEVVAYLARAPKSNALYEAYGKVQDDIKEYGTLPVPLHIRNAPTQLMKDFGYGRGYKYNPDYAKRGEEVSQQYLPDELKDKKYLE
ncbi:AAA family ATPase [Candidatus Uhrbacteria bacterium RIFCSPLOWO2_02_FULL_48_12]|uniref:Replication-associated recombination protein A n=1 Tax=Candidatus Uhrbacteria bacterium RIFCSPLOWO2_02_FULL_48_12 TaxID=1802407 RepID=A0A1F7V9E9_9BACT|nr:MAG: AAA family ATPase [Candidatus Uhrbacteria bacterium RIFCSPLOWO2_02_FULL_48_12]